MFADCFVTPAIAVALRAANFDEPCMAHYEGYEHNGELQSSIHYSNNPTDPHLFNSTIQGFIIKCPNIFDRGIKNSELQPGLYSAPIYEQVRDWFFKQGLRLHDCYISRKVFSREKNGAWVYQIYDTESGKSLWPQHNWHNSRHECRYFNTWREAWDDAILNGLKLLPVAP